MTLSSANATYMNDLVYPNKCNFTMEFYTIVWYYLVKSVDKVIVFI